MDYGNDGLQTVGMMFLRTMGMMFYGAWILYFMDHRNGVLWTTGVMFYGLWK